MESIEIYADIWCPFTHVGLKRLVERRTELGSSVKLRIRPWPLETINDGPLDCQFIDDEIRDLVEQVSPDLFDGFDKNNFPTSTIEAMALAESAYEVSDELGESASLMLRNYLFEEGRDISDQAVLNEIAEELQIPPVEEHHLNAVANSLSEGQAKGVIGSPHFFTNVGGFFCPALNIKRVDEKLQISADMEAFDEFANSCFA